MGSSKNHQGQPMMTVLWEQSVKERQPQASPPAAAGLLVSPGLVVIRLLLSWGGKQREQVKMSPILLLLLRFSLFFLNKLSSDCYKPLTSFQILKKWTLTSFASIPTALMEIFRGPDCSVFPDIPPFSGTYPFLDINY